MHDAAIRRYESALGREVKGVRRRKQVRKAFRRSLTPFLEEHPSPAWTDLVEAFGPPEQMARELLEAIPDLPRLLSLRQKVGIAAAICVIVAVGCAGVYCWSTRPEEEVTITDGSGYVFEGIPPGYTFGLDEVFWTHDYTWTQPGPVYLLLAENTNQVDITIFIYYSDRQPEHRFVVPAGERRAFRVEDARKVEHVISFVTPDGSMSGRVRLLFPVGSI